MKFVSSHSITHTPDTDAFDGEYLFQVATEVTSSQVIDISLLLKEFKNDRVEYKKDYKLWNQVYPTEKEFEIFKDVVEKSLSNGQKVHIINCTLREEVEIVREFYQRLGYFDAKENRFVVPFSTAPITIGVNIRNLVYSTKDYKSKREQICFLPPPRESWHVKTLFAAINSWVVSTININDIAKEKELLVSLVNTEKINLTTLSQMIYGNFLELGCQIGKVEKWIMKL